MARYKSPRIFEYGPNSRVPSMFRMREMEPRELMTMLMDAYDAEDNPLLVRKGKVIVPSYIHRDAIDRGRILEPSNISSTSDPLAERLILESGNFRFDPGTLNFVVSSNEELYAGADLTALDGMKDKHPHPVVLGYLQAPLVGQSTKFLSYFAERRNYRDYARDSGNTPGARESTLDSGLGTMGQAFLAAMKTRKQ